ncbi:MULTISPECIES: RlmE family RNA methyltransferase [Methylobacterium]|uniref:Ribosomal RNA large subunit methyltransferase E n=1 Tax=Methylobacterium goesingense TaxID=243690 RepID=A0ABV2L1Q2_9HYPH|nr:MULTISPECIES: RlmE family RNA methyltransferase [Methylobacterium]MBY0260045.1 RlmE family RNA methyltransferase [Methylobacterium sp.]MCJ2045123.1 RlmE family RNA methyltransferase [Methylobacterium sp. J-078]GJD76653.1 Ribosomal RNA large subunit methyltransferase E [Methylobacterium goesingense]
MSDRRGAGAGLRGELKQRVKTGRGRTASQKRWLERQLNDPYVARAKREGYRSRAAFKLIEIDERFKLLKPGQRIVDLGAAPGGWSQVAAKIVGDSGRIVGIDLLEIEPMTGVEFITLDFLAPEAPKLLTDLLGGPADLVLSDMAANTTGHKQTDHLRIIGLAETAAEFAREILAPGGSYLAKVFQGGTEGTLLADLKRDFASVRHVKPNASRADSSELYVLASGYRGPAGAALGPQAE